MKRFNIRLFTAFILFTSLFRFASAKEGMWLPILLNISDMQAMGMKLSADDIYSINNGSLKDAIVHFNGGCTAEVISDQGLILTNHHCGFSQIQQHSTVENDYLKDGFWAANKAAELTNPGVTATFMVRIEDVTERVLKGTASLEDGAYALKIDENIKSIEEEATRDTHYEAFIRPFFYGNQYFLFVTETFKDVRLVGAPPSSIGKYGADTDNWMWPRHTGDFSMFRIYAGKDNKPADISPDNVPLKPRHHLPINMQGVKEGDFTMVYGFPGTTQQFLISDEVEFITSKLNPTRIAMRDKSLEVINATMDESQELRIQYAAKQARIANAWKKWQGENKGLARLGALEKKRALESAFERKISQSEKLKEKYGGIVAKLKDLSHQMEPYTMARSSLIEFWYYGPEFIRFTLGFSKLVSDFDELSDQEQEDMIATQKERVEKFFEDYYAPADQQILAKLAGPYFESLIPELRPDVYAEINDKYQGDWDAYAEDLFEKSYFTDKDRMLSFLDKFKSKKALKDPGYQLADGVLSAWRSKAAAQYGALEAQKEMLMKTYVAGLMEVFPDKNYWPDANSTLRVTYGKVEGFEPADGVVYQYQSTLEGVMEKYEPGDREFDLPQKLIDLYEKKDYGRYANADGTLPVCFTGSNHTTGGNSGSPAIDGNGYLIGLNFDRAWESTMSDIMFDPDYCRNIMVDVRYVLFIVDKFAGAGHLVKEMTLK